MRTCKTKGCGYTAPIEDFPPAGGRSKASRSRLCRSCKQEYDRNHYHTRRDKAGKLAQQNIRNNAMVARLGNYLTGKACVDCGEDNPIVLEFDHREGVEKCGDISDLSRRWGWAKLLTEIEKCDLVCANCHRIRTWRRSGGSARMPISSEGSSAR